MFYMNEDWSIAKRKNNFLLPSIQQIIFSNSINTNAKQRLSSLTQHLEHRGKDKVAMHKKQVFQKRCVRLKNLRRCDGACL